MTITPSPDLPSGEDRADDLAVGVNGTYTISVNNTLGALATSVAYTVTDPMPAGMTIVGLPSGTGWNCAASTATNVSCTSNTGNAGGAAITRTRSR